ncbi:hypothetical protein HRbin19_00141 [bacterium HR19]|nr:hypothetical protein HRbin19_00141 [bacterium HR19]
MILESTILYLMVELLWEYKSPRSYSMGGLAVSLQDAQTSFFFNPAGMFGTKSLDIITTEIFISYDTISSIKGFADSLSDLKNQEKTISQAKKIYGKNYSAGVFTFPNFTLTVQNVSFGLGVLGGAETGLSISVPSNITVRNTFFSTQGQVLLGGAVAFLDNSLITGISVSAFKISQKAEVEIRENEVGERITDVFPVINKKPPEILSDILSGNCQYPLKCAIGFGGINLGVIWKPLKKGINIGLDVRNMLDPSEKFTGDIGISYSDKLRFFNYTLGIDFQDMFFALSEDKSFFKRVFMGGEVSVDIPSIKRFFSVMFGLGQLYSSLGIELNLKIISILVGTYGRELGKEAPADQMRYYFFKLSI